MTRDVPSDDRRGVSPRRPSLMSQVRLSDGRLAWPVARAAGLSEAAFRKRLNSGLLPDVAVSKPVAKRGPSRAAQRAQWAAQRAADAASERAARRAISSRPFAERLDSSSDDYGGVICRGDDWRVIVSPRGAFYAVQVLDRSAWCVEREFPSAATLRPWFFGVLIADLPQAACDAVAALPDDPAACGLVPYHSRKA